MKSTTKQTECNASKAELEKHIDNLCEQLEQALIAKANLLDKKSVGTGFSTCAEANGREIEIIWNICKKRI